MKQFLIFYTEGSTLKMLPRVAESAEAAMEGVETQKWHEYFVVEAALEVTGERAG